MRISSIRLTGGIQVEIVGKSEPEASTKARELAAPGKAGVAAWKIYAAVAVALAIVWQFYYFRELAAALLFFTIIFLVLAAIGGAIYLIGRISQKTFSIAEPAARRGLVYAEVISRKTFHRPRSVPVP
jgi:K+-sensing histidine kinase KdpD|nr:hypothetical protein [Candidatus Acidoferrales bacterium]